MPPIRIPVVPLVDTKRLPAFSIGVPLSRVPVQYPRAFVHSVSIDPTGQYVTIAQTFQNWNVCLPQYLSLKDYITRRSTIETQNQWTEYVRTHVTPTRTADQETQGITIETPKIKSEAFRRVFGGETFKLNVTGNITIDGGLSHEKRKGRVIQATDRAPSTNFKMKQTQRFRVEGKIGENVSVLVDQDSERPFEFENAMKLQYTSDEDGIIQKIEAGNISLSLPSTRFVTFSAQNTGLFGVKSQMKIGKLDVTAIASMEKGQKNRKKLTGGKDESRQEIHDYEYKRGTYYFLDYYYRSQFTVLDDKGRYIVDPSRIITKLEVYKSDYNYQNNVDAFQAWAVLEPSDPNTSETNISQENVKEHFLRLEPNVDYFINKNLGYIYMNMPLQESEILAVAYKDSSGREYGTLQIDSTKTAVLKLIKPRTPRPSDKSWNLEWKNVYSLGARNITKEEFEEGFDITIYFKTSNGDPQQSIKTNGESKSYLNIFGLDNTDTNGEPNPDKKVDIDPNILNLSRGELIFPNLRPFDPDSTSGNLGTFPNEMNDKRTPAIYDTTVASYIHQQSKFYIDVTSSRRSPTHNLGMNVIPGSEKIRLNGRELRKDVDYTIDYDFGTLTLLSDEATNPDANIEIEYESQQLFSIDKKSLVGARAEYTLWDNGMSRSFIGGTFLYFNQMTLDRRVYVGKDAPMRNIVWDVNTALQFQPNFITKALNSLPLLNVTESSSIALEGEIAQVIPNPNTLNNEPTGDSDGVAYLDDFEGSKRQVSLGVLQINWTPASPPSKADSASALLTRQGRLFWYNPLSQVFIKEIWPKREVTTSFGGTDRIQVLTLDFTPNNNLQDPRLSWGGIQRALSAGYADQTDSRFLEVWVQGDQGRLNVDLGRISEDVIPNQQLNTEDKLRGGIREGILNEDEDTGLDGMFGKDPEFDPQNPLTFFHAHEPAQIQMKDGKPYGEPYDFWDINGDGIKQENEPWSYDDWEYTTGGAYNRINGTENNRTSGRTIYPDEEDLNGNGNVDLNNDYFEFRFSLDKTTPDTVFIAGGKENVNGWRLYRIPLDRPSKVVGTPDWSRIEFVRVWVDSLDQNAKLTIAEINLAGNEWKLRGVMTPPDTTYNLSDDSTMSLTVINTHDNPEYKAPPGVEGIVDPIQKIMSKEQSLVLKMDNLKPNATAAAQKQFYQSENLINYRTLKMFVHGGNIYNEIPDNIEFFLQWGSDTQNKVYYEVIIPRVYPAWHDSNTVEIAFDDLNRLKLEMQSKSLETDSLLLENGHIITIAGNPSLRNIRWLTVGVRNKGNASFTGEIWIDELRLSKVRKEKGMAMRARADIKLSDFMILGGEYERKDADFHTINERFSNKDHSQSGLANANIQLHKLLPASWGVSLPVTLTYSKTRQTPKYLPGDDILVSAVESDSLLKVIRTENEQKSFNIRFAKNVKSRNFWVRYFIDPFSANFNYKNSHTNNSQIKYSDNVNKTMSVNYNLSFNNQNYWKPFKWMGEKGFLKKIAQIKFFYLPTKVNLNATGNDIDEAKEDREGVISKTPTSKFKLDYRTGFRPFQALSIDYSRSEMTDMRHSRWVKLFSDPGERIAITQNLSTNFTPTLFSWLTNSLRYSTDFSWNNNLSTKERGTSQNARVQTNFQFTGQFNPKNFMQIFKKSSGRQGRIRRPATQPDKKSEEKTERKKSFPLLFIFSWMGNLIQKIDPVSVDIGETKSANHAGVQGIPTFAYQMGTSINDPGVDISPNVTEPAVISKERRFSVRSGFTITSRISANLDYKITDAENRAAQTTGTFSKSTLLWKNKDFPFPNWSLQWRGLEKLPLLSQIVKSASLNHAFLGERQDMWSETRSSITRENVSRSFRPLVGLSLTFKNDLSATMQYNTLESLEKQKSGYNLGTTRKITSDISITAQYKKRGGIRLPFLKGKKLENTIDFSLAYNNHREVIYLNKGISAGSDNITKGKNWSLKPEISYSFTNTLRGGMYLEVKKREDKKLGMTTVTDFGLNVVISLTGS